MLRPHFTTKVGWLAGIGRRLVPPLAVPETVSLNRPSIDQIAQWPASQLPGFVRESEVARHYLQLLGPLAWDRFPDRHSEWHWLSHEPLADAPFVAAYLVKLDQEIRSANRLRRFLVAHPALVWLLGFPLVASQGYSWGFDCSASLPTHRHFSRVLRELPNAALQFLLDSAVDQLVVALPPDANFGRQVSFDSKAILAWVKENNPKAYIKEGRFDKSRRLAGDPDCRLGCKRKRNQGKQAAEEPRPAGATPTAEGQPTAGLGMGKGEYYWGYASGIVVTKIAGWGEFVVAELTQTFDHSDVSYFLPLMTQVERRLGFKPPYGTGDAAFDAFYVYHYFHDAGGFAAVPLRHKSNQALRRFTADGLPLCAAGLPMPLKGTFLNGTSLIPHQRGRYACPLLFPQPTAECCPVSHPNWPEGGCLLTMPTSIGARIRYQLDREEPAYKTLYNQRTATERIFSQAVELGIERPKLRNRHSITNRNTLIYLLLNLRQLQRVQARRHAIATQQA